MNSLKVKKNHLISTLFLLLTSVVFAQVQVEVNIDVNHKVGEHTSFDRSKWMIVSSQHDAGIWNDVVDKFDYLINDLDTYFGRSTGHITSQGKNVNEDPNRVGFADPDHIKILGDNYKSTYSNKTDRFVLEDKSNLVVAMQQLPFFSNGANATNGGWYFSSTDTEDEPFGTAVGEFAADYFNHSFGEGGITGSPMPEYFEVMNEPAYHFVDTDQHGGGTIEQIFKFHKTVADIVHDKVPGLKVGGYGTAFPDFDEGGNLSQWEERWKTYIKEYGSSFDFYSIHLYDRPIENGKVIEQFRKGGRNEATLDMIEHYSILEHGETKPLVVTEYGGQLWGMTTEERLWRPHNDWRRLEAFNGMLMQFLERPNTIERALPFSDPKAEWGYDHENNVPYRCRLLRKANEPEEYSGEWVWTDFVKFYELWSDVKGIRLDTYADNLDFQVDAYTHENEVYVILNNIESANIDFELNLKGLNSNKIKSVEVKRLFFTDDEIVKLTTNTYDDFQGIIDIRDDETIIAKYTFKNDIQVDNASEESKYYATTYKQPITANTPVVFSLKDIVKETNGEAVLRLGLARAKESTRFPTEIKVNGNTVNIPDNYRGDAQGGRKQFFGMLEVGVPYEYLEQGDNSVEVTFSDSDGFVSTCALQVFNFTRPIKRFFFPTSIELHNPDTHLNTVYRVGDSIFVACDYHAGSDNLVDTNNPVKFILQEVTSDNTIVKEYSTVSEETQNTLKGIVNDTIDLKNAIASADLTAGNYYKLLAVLEVTDGTKDTSLIEPINLVGSTDEIISSQVVINPDVANIKVQETIQFSYSTIPLNVDDAEVEWTSSKPDVVSINEEGLAIAKKGGEADIIVKMKDSGVESSCRVTVPIVIANPIIEFDDENKYKNKTYTTDDKLEVSYKFHAGTGHTVDNSTWEGVRVVLRQLNKDWAPENDYEIIDNSLLGFESGTATVSFNLGEVIPTAEIPSESFYYLYLTFTSSNGISYNKGLKTNMNLIKVVHPESLVVSPPADTLNINESTQLSYIITPSNVTDQSVLWESTNNVIAEVDASGKVSANSKGEVKIIVISNDGNLKDTCNIVIQEDVSVKRNPFNDNLIVYPIPADDKLFIKSNSTIDYHILIYNLQGSLLLKQDVNEPEVIVDIHELAPGNYILKAVNGKVNAQRLFIKN